MLVKEIISRSAMKTIIVLATACLCFTAMPAGAEDEIKIGAAVSLTGNFAAGGTGEVDLGPQGSLETPRER